MSNNSISRLQNWLVSLSTVLIIISLVTRTFTASNLGSCPIPVLYPSPNEDTHDMEATSLKKSYPWQTNPPLAYSRPNRSGPEVVALQERLRELGLLNGEVDGFFGLATLTALKRFQVKYMLAPTGMVDEATSQRLAHPRPAFEPPFRPPAPPTYITVSIPNRTLTVHLGDGSEYVFPCTVGHPRTPTPTGSYRIVEKGRWRGQFGGYWMGLNTRFGFYGIHGTNEPWSVGEAQSEGCVRLLSEYARVLYGWIPIDTPVTIQGLPSGRLLMDGSKGSDVQLVQRKLIEKGYLSGSADGVYGPATTRAVMRFQKDHRLHPNGRVTKQIYQLLDIQIDPEQGTPSPAAVRRWR